MPKNLFSKERDIMNGYWIDLPNLQKVFNFSEIWSHFHAKKQKEYKIQHDIHLNINYKIKTIFPPCP